MPNLRLSLGAFALSCAVAGAAALVPVPGQIISSSSPAVAGLEPNGGQAKAEILFLCRGSSSLAVTAQSILYSPLGAGLNFLASNPNPAVRFANPLPGVTNSFTGAVAQKWVTGLSRYSTVNLAEVYPGIDAQYEMGADGRLTLRLLLRAGFDPKAVEFEFPKAVNMALTPDGTLVLQLGPSRFDPRFAYPPPAAFQDGVSGRVSRSASYALQSATRFGLQIQGLDPTIPLQIEIKLTESNNVQFIGTATSPIVDAAGNTFIATTVPDAAGKDAPFPADRWEGCGTGPIVPIACPDVAVYKFSKVGALVFVSYLAGRTRESASFLRFAPDGALVLAGSTDSADFPVTVAALQPIYGGPAATSNGSQQVGGDFFAARLDAKTGLLLASTFFGGAGVDSIGETALGADGSLYFSCPSGWALPAPECR